MTDEAKTVSIERTNDGIAIVDEHGKRTQYSSENIRTLHINAISMKARRSINLQLDAKFNEEPFNKVLEIEGQLDDNSIEVLGFPETRSRTITVQFSVLTDKDQARIKEPEATFKPVLLGFNQADWEIGNRDEWWVSCSLPQIQFDTLWDAYSTESITKLSFGFSLSNLYVDFSYATPSQNVKWFTEPGKEGKVGFGPLPRGFLSSFNLETSAETLEKMKPTPAEILSDFRENGPSNAPAQIDTNLETVRSLNAIVAGLDSLKIIGWALVSIAVAVVIKLH